MTNDNPYTGSYARHTNPDGSEGGWVDDTARVDPTATIHRTARVRQRAKVGENVIVGQRSIVGADAVIGFDVLIQARCTIGSNVEVSQRTRIGNSVRIGDSVRIGVNVRLGDGVTVSDGVDIGHDVVFSVNVWIGISAIVASRTTILAGTVIEDGASFPEEVDRPDPEPDLEFERLLREEETIEREVLSHHEAVETATAGVVFYTQAHADGGWIYVTPDGQPAYPVRRKHITHINYYVRDKNDGVKNVTIYGNLVSGAQIPLVEMDINTGHTEFTDEVEDLVGELLAG